MTYSTPGMSRPRAATSVATRRGTGVGKGEGEREKEEGEIERKGREG